MFSKYEYCHYSAWNILGNCAWNILEQYDNWQVVFSRAVEIHTPLGKIHPAWSVRNLGSTKIVLGNIQLNSAWRNPGSTIMCCLLLTKTEYIMTAEEKTQLEKLVEKYLKEDAYKPRGWGERAARDFHSALNCEWLLTYSFRPDPA